jgi:two-component system, LuxR family, response regulator FixJ
MADGVVYVVDDDAAVRSGLKWLIESVDLEVAECASAQAFLDTYDRSRPGCLVLDVRLRGMSGLDLQAELGRRAITIPTIIITGHGDVPMAVRAMKLGAIDFVEKPFNDQQLLERIQHAIEADQDARRGDRERAEVEALLATLSPREREVLDLLVLGKANKEVADQLGLSTRTVEGHRARLMEKLACTSLAELVRLSLRAAPADA